ncbi:MAG: glycosyltransferase family 4 protein [Candidatus Dormibacteria bacterium]
MSDPAARPQPRHVALIAPPWYPVPPSGYGGIELVVNLLCIELRRLGHRVTLIAAEGSGHDAITLAPVSWAHDLGHRGERLRELAYAQRVVAALQSLDSVDIVHDHVGFATLLSSAVLGVAPVVHTVHGPINDADRDFYAGLPSGVGLVSLSGAQRDTAPELPWLGCVHNAVDLSHLTEPGSIAKEGFLLCLARICADKGQHLAIEVARRTGMRLVLAGKIDSSRAGAAYWHELVEPHVDGTSVVHIGNVHGAQKTRLLSRATALVAPIDWDEPFGLSVVEAMASGTPAISMRRGAAPELIDEGVTGMLVDNPDDMVEAALHVHDIDPMRCAQVARERFSPAAMTEGYLSLYRRAAGDGTPPLARRSPGHHRGAS